MPRTLTVDDTEIRTLQLALQYANANAPSAQGLATLTAKVAALSDPEPAAQMPAPATSKPAK